MRKFIGLLAVSLFAFTTAASAAPADCCCDDTCDSCEMCDCCCSE